MTGFASEKNVSAQYFLSYDKKIFCFCDLQAVKFHVMIDHHLNANNFMKCHTITYISVNILMH